MDESGKVLGVHEGIPFYTIGQREGLRIPYKHPLYVIEINKDSNTIIVGPRESKLRGSVEVRNVNWIVEPDKKVFRAKVKIRYKHEKALATLTLTGRDGVNIKFNCAQESPTPGQAAVFYDHDTVLGGGWIV